MSYTKEQRAANAAKAASAAAQPVPQASEPHNEPASENNPNLDAPAQRPAYRNDDRTAAFDEIVARHNRESGNEVPEEEPAAAPEPAPKPTPKPETRAEAAPEAQQPIAEAAPAPAEPASEPEPAPEMLTVKVDGEEFSVAKSDVEEAGGVRAYQTMKAADNRLKKAGEALAQTRQMQAQIAAFAQSVQPKAEAAKPITADDALQAIRFGTPEEGMNVLNKLVSQAVGKPVDPDQLMNRTMVEMEKINSAKQFTKEFADIAQNPILWQTAVTMDRQRMAEAVQNGRIGPQFDFAEHYRKIGNEIRSAFGRQSQPASAPVTTAGTPSQPSDKEARKASIVNLPSSSARAELPAEAKPDSREEILNQYRKSRGQSTV